MANPIYPYHIHISSYDHANEHGSPGMAKQIDLWRLGRNANVVLNSLCRITGDTARDYSIKVTPVALGPLGQPPFRATLYTKDFRTLKTSPLRIEALYVWIRGPGGQQFAKLLAGATRTHTADWQIGLDIDTAYIDQRNIARAGLATAPDPLVSKKDARSLAAATNNPIKSPAMPSSFGAKLRRAFQGDDNV